MEENNKISQSSTIIRAGLTGILALTGILSPIASIIAILIALSGIKKAIKERDKLAAVLNIIVFILAAIIYVFLRQAAILIRGY